jgi:diguanylate cyclase (GGDEF)-like protein
MPGTSVGGNSNSRLSAGLWYAMLTIIFVHAVLLLLLPRETAASRCLTAAIPLIAAFCCLWRARRLQQRERSSWWWISAGLVLWSAAHVTEALISASPAASNLAMDPSDFLYLTAGFPLLLALSTTSEIGSIRGIIYLNLLQALLASGLVYVRLFRMPVPIEFANVVMQRIYASYCLLLAFAAALRLFTWSTLEERYRIRAVCGAIWIYLCIELALDSATRWWGLRQGTFLDLLWSAPFLYAGSRALRAVPEEGHRGQSRRLRGGKGVLLQSLCPLLITSGIFVLAASVLSTHRVIAVSAMLSLLLIQGIQSGIIQMTYHSGQRQLLEQERDLKQANAALEQLSNLDPLTAISNRRHFTSVFEVEWLRAARKRTHLAVLMMDIDYFKGVNDRHGHTYGDRCLAQIADLLRGALRRGNDLLARYGGEEFILLLPDANLEVAISVAERMKRAVDESEIVNLASPFDQRITISIGVASCRPEPGMNAGTLIDLADQALYRAKHQGRNQICCRDFSAELT